MERVGEHPVPPGPLAVRWIAVAVETPRAGALGRARVSLENAGSAPWRPAQVKLSYHWLDERANPIVWDGIRTELEHVVEPGERLEADVAVRAALPPGPYRLAFDLVEEHRLWFAELGNVPLDLAATVEPRIERALAVVGGDPDALAAQEEPLAPQSEAAAVAHLGEGVAPATDWSRRVLDLHQEGYAVVGGAVATQERLFRRAPRELEPWAPGQGRIPRFAHPLVCPSIVADVQPVWDEPVDGLPAARAPEGEPSLFDGTIVVRARRRAGRRRG